MIAGYKIHNFFDGSKEEKTENGDERFKLSYLKERKKKSKKENKKKKFKKKQKKPKKP